MTADLSRRHFLATAAGLTLAPLARAADTEPLFTVALVTDTHYGKSAGISRQLPQVVERVNAAKPALTLFAGDLVDSGQLPERQANYAVWKDAVKGLKSEWRAVPGNHDPDEQFVKHVQNETDWSVSHKGTRFVGFRNAEPNPGHMGVVTPAQLAWLAGECAAAAKAGEKVVFVAHVAYHENKHPDVGWYVKEGREAFGKLLATNRHVVAAFSGHFHCGMRGWDDTAGVHEVVLPCASYNTNRGLDKAPGFSFPETKPGFALADVFADKLRLTYKRLDGETAATKDLTYRKA